jgi:hypothetical protein
MTDLDTGEWKDNLQEVGFKHSIIESGEVVAYEVICAQMFTVSIDGGLKILQTSSPDSVRNGVHGLQCCPRML